ncbi:hypothetical protein PEC301899_02930 [Pectobacterium carotovorum subsp. carotovorum]|nr:hypothetical protein PEC301899_02930 [Pectobacterium carotovorum subsp. carotovorum]
MELPAVVNTRPLIGESDACLWKTVHAELFY